MSLFRPSARQRGRPGALVALAGLAIGLALHPAGPAGAATHNVSQLVLGTHEPLPAGTARTWACGSACRYASVSGVQMSHSYGAWPGAHDPATWPVFFSHTAPNYDSTQESLAIAAAPAGTQYLALPSGLWQRARVGFSYLYSAPDTERQLDVQTFRTGNGASALSYAVRIETPADRARPTYLRFRVPASVRDAQQAGYIGGPSGQQPFSTPPRRLQARSIVDVYVDGLPVWSAQSVQLRPRRFPASLGGMLQLDGDQPLDGGTATLFLGTLPAGSQRTAVIVMRSDLRVDAPTCHTVPNTLGDGQRRCDARLEGLSLPSKSTAPFYIHTPDIAVYTR
jgi:hypothetical protein